MPAFIVNRVLRAALPLAACLAFAGQAQAHGSITQPASRAASCHNGSNSNCGAVRYEPQSLEGVNGFPAGGPADGQIASAGLPQFAAMDEQTSSRWVKRPLAAGLQTFGWQLTANHVARGFRYFITRQDWNPNQRLSRAAFDATPFCVVDGRLQQPAMQVQHQCQVPQRSGYQVVLGIWDIGDTANSFYQVVDVLFHGNNPPPASPWVVKGSLFPSVDLVPGDQVATRVFDSRGERPDLQTRLAIVNAGAGLRNTWPYLLAGRINAEQPLLRAGQMAADGSIAPVQGQNEVHAQAASGIQRVEVQITKAPAPPGVDLLVSGLATQHLLVGGQTTLMFMVTAVGEIDVSASLFDSAGRTLGAAGTSLNNSGQQLTLAVASAQAGAHQLVVNGTVRGSATVIQKTFALTFATAASGHSFSFPQGLASYRAGTRVLQPKDGRVYECRPFPNSGYCVQWSPAASQFEPGVGSHWQEAWIAR